MPELPDIVVYVEHLERRIVGGTFEGATVASLNLLRTAEPTLDEVTGQRVDGVGRLGKRIVISLEDDVHLVLHLMIAGRLHWKDKGAPEPKKKSKPAAARTDRLSVPSASVRAGLGRNGLAAFRFSSGILTLTEAGTKQRASLHVVRGEDAVQDLDPGGIDVYESDVGAFRRALVLGNHTLKRALTDPRLFSGIGNAYSDEILHRAKLSPFRLGEQLDLAEVTRLWEATRATLTWWTDRLREESGDDFPEGVTAFRKEMAVHGKYKQPCPVCGAPVQRVVYAENEMNYCAVCQTAGRLLADRALSRLLKSDWPKTLEELEESKAARRKA